MTSFLQKKRWDLFCIKGNILISYGFSTGKILLYDEELIRKLREISFTKFPASIILLSSVFCYGRCYLMSILMSLAFLKDKSIDCNLLYIDIDGLRLKPKKSGENLEDFEHCVVEIKYENGKTYIIDTTFGFIIEKELYWKIENPRVNKVTTKEEIAETFDSNEMSNCDESETIEIDEMDRIYTLDYLKEHLNEERSYYFSNGMLKKEIDIYKQSFTSENSEKHVSVK